LNVTNGSNNIEVGSPGAAAGANTIRIGTQGIQKATYIAGISGTAMTGAHVVVSSSGRLACSRPQPISSATFNRWAIAVVGCGSCFWSQFRPKQDPQGQRQYGRIAEQVAKVYPELVVRGDKAEIESVQYRELIPLLLNEMLHQQAALTELTTQNQMLRAALAQQNAIFTALLDRLNDPQEQRR
jgi:hypothetical protein